MDRVTQTRLLKHLIDYNILSNEQNGSRPSLNNDNATYQLTNEILYALKNKLQIGGIFCDLEKAFDCVNHKSLLSKLITDNHYKLYKSYVDRCLGRTSKQTYTHYTPTGATPLVTIYVTEDLQRQKQGVKTTAAAFTDHLAVMLKVVSTTTFIYRGRGIWRMNISYLNYLPFQGKIKGTWIEWKTHVTISRHSPPLGPICETYHKTSLYTRRHAEKQRPDQDGEFLLHSHL